MPSRDVHDDGFTRAAHPLVECCYICVHREMVEEVGRGDGVGCAVAKWKARCVAGDAKNAFAFDVEEMFDFEINGDPDIRTSGREIVGRAGSHIDHRLQIANASQQPAVDRTPAKVAIEALKIAKRALHVGARRIVFVEELGLIETPRREHHARFSTSAEFFEPKAIVLHTATSTRPRRPTSGT